MNSNEVSIHIHQGWFAGTGAIVRLPQCQWSKPDGYGKISQCITTTKHSKAKTVCIFLGIYCIGLNMLPRDSFVLNLYSPLAYSTEEFQALQLFALWCLVTWINHLPPVCWSAFWKSSFKQQLVCKFDKAGNDFSLFYSAYTCTFTYIFISYSMLIPSHLFAPFGRLK